MKQLPQLSVKDLISSVKSFKDQVLKYFQYYIYWHPSFHFNSSPGKECGFSDGLLCICTGETQVLLEPLDARLMAVISETQNTHK